MPHWLGRWTLDTCVRNAICISLGSTPPGVLLRFGVRPCASPGDAFESTHFVSGANALRSDGTRVNLRRNPVAIRSAARLKLFLAPRIVSVEKLQSFPGYQANAAGILFDEVQHGRRTIKLLPEQDEWMSVQAFHSHG
ncbi:hypothetical protein [Burkholderia gladioli]|uniref:hypothetical protein n=1 Tax=Burkholderia gladioli TaxID=28095 RepID=UPI0011D284A7|nr:hypothetical protein [Burkholderia gladioli]MBW5287373.1 hypothetical protein [Burkholderia gladioli]